MTYNVFGGTLNPTLLYCSFPIFSYFLVAFSILNCNRCQNVVCYSVRSNRHREVDSSLSLGNRVIASSTQSVPHRQFCTPVDSSDVQPSPVATQDVNRNMRRYSAHVEYTAAGGQQDFGVSGGGHMFEVGDRRPISGADSVGMVTRLSDDDFHSSNSTTWNGSGQYFNNQLSYHRWPSQDPTYSRNHEKCPSVLSPPAVGYRTSSWNDNTRTNNAEVYSQNQTAASSRVEDGLPPSPHSAQHYFNDIAARLSEQQFHPRNTAFHHGGYAAGNRNIPYHEPDSTFNAENSSLNYISAGYGNPAAGRSRSFRSPVDQECSPVPPPLPATSPPHDPPQRPTSSCTRSASSSDVNRLTTPYNAVLHRNVFESDVDRRLLTPSGQGVLGMLGSPNMNMAVSETSINNVQTHREQSHLVNGRRYIHENGFGNSAADDDLSQRITTTDEDDLRSRLDKLPANQSQTSVLRRLSQEFYGASRSRYGINPTGRMSLGSASSCLSTSGNDLSQPPVVRNVDTNCPHSESERPRVAAGSSDPGAVEPADDTGASFVRARKTQMSLRKAFGIFDDFEVAHTEVKQLPVVSEDEVPGTGVPQCSDSVGHTAGVDHKLNVSHGRRSSESEFHQQSGAWRNVDRLAERPTVDSSSAMQRSMSLGSAVQPVMSAVSHGHRLSTASDAQSSHSSSSGSTNGVRPFLDLSTGSSARSGDMLLAKEASVPMKLVKAKSKSLPRVAMLPSDSTPALSYPQPSRWNEDTDRLQVNAAIYLSLFSLLYNIFSLIIIYTIQKSKFLNQFLYFYLVL